jgi:hypothetical protein
MHTEAFVVPLEIMPSKRCQQHTKGSKVLGRYQSCLQYPEKYCLDPLGYMFPRKTPNHSNIRQKGKGTYFHPVLPIITIKEICIYIIIYNARLSIFIHV